MAAKSVQYYSNIWIWEESVAYRREVERVLARIGSTQAGQTLIRHINIKPGTMLILPFKPTRNNPVDAGVEATSKANAAARGFKVEPPGAPSFTGTGKGSNTEISYHPATFREVNKRRGYIAPGFGPAEALFHEMIHGLRELSGVERLGELVIGEENTMTSVEEFYAVMAANVYRSDRGFTLLRANHRTKSPPLRDARRYQTFYYEQYQPYIDKWFNEQRAFCLDMAHVSAKFNPFREAAVRLGLMTGSTVSMRL